MQLQFVPHCLETHRVLHVGCVRATYTRLRMQSYSQLIRPRGQLPLRDGHAAVKVADDTTQGLRQPWLLLHLCEPNQGREIRDLVDGESALWSTIWHGGIGNRLKKRCERLGRRAPSPG